VPLERLLQTFDAGHVALIVENGRFLGLITKSDVLNLWRRTLR
jgi:cystathionine beta-synthase